jgi:hypothetical protein
MCHVTSREESFMAQGERRSADMAAARSKKEVGVG